MKLLIGIFFPGIVRRLEVGRRGGLQKAIGQEAIDFSLYIDVEDNGSDVTAICLAGAALLYTGVPKFEFRKILQKSGGHYNFVWVRDIHRTNYNLAPDGSPNGYAFYTRIIGDALSRLRSSHNVAIGASGGGAAAIALSGMLPIHRIIAFNPVFQDKDYGSSRSVRRAIFDWRKMLRKPRAYIEVIMVSLGSRFIWKRLCRLIGEQHIPDILEYYLRKNPPAQAVVFYSMNCRPDAEQTLIFKDVPTVTLMPIRSDRHGFMIELKQRGELGPLIHKEILIELDRCLSSSCAPGEPSE